VGRHSDLRISRSVDGRVLPTQGARNPALVIMALADRCASVLAGKQVTP
jgi:choline dehydrogenase-like flavoprotein